MTHSFQIGIIADDFTGAMDSGVQFARYGLETAFAVAAAPDSEVVVLNTASREIDPALARARCAAAARQLIGRRIFKKIDSTLRGHLTAELEGLLSILAISAPGAKIVVCPATPQQGRTVQEGLLYVNGTLLHKSVFKNDPFFPAITASVSERIGLPAVLLPLSVVRAGIDVLAERIATASSAVVVTDTLDNEDLMRVAQAVVTAGAIPCGALGLADAWACALTGRQPAEVSFCLPDQGCPALVVAGSANASTHAQIAALARHLESRVCQITVPLTQEAEARVYAEALAIQPGDRAVILCPAVTETTREPAWLAFGQTVSRLAAELVHRRRPSALLIAGGETANHLCELLGVQSVFLLGEAAPGIPFGHLSGGPADGLLLVTKAGGFGQPDTLERIVYP